MNYPATAKSRSRGRNDMTPKPALNAPGNLTGMALLFLRRMPVVAACCVGLGLFAAEGAEQTPDQLYESALPSVMTLTVEAKGGAKFVGTAFLAVDHGIAVSAWHLVKDARKVVAQFADGEVVPVLGVIDCHPRKDLALLRIGGTSARPLAPLAKGWPRVGSRAFVIGAPRGFEFFLSDGLVSQTPTLDGFRQVQVSCPISPGNSGGPVFNGQGEVIGIVAWSEKDAQNLNFATPAAAVFELNPARPTVAWTALSKSPLSKTSHRSSQPVRDRKTGATEQQDEAALRALLRQSAGRRLTITVTGQAEDTTFSFTVPPGFVK